MTDPVASWFDGVADSYDEVLPFFRTAAELTVGLLDPPAGTRALDVAAGRGALAGALAARGCRVTATDAAPRMTALIARDLPAVEARTMDATDLDFPAGTFDLVVCGFAFHVFTDPEAALAEAVRVLRPGGRVALTVPGGANEADPLVRLFAEYRRHADRHGNDADMAELLAGLQPEATDFEIAVEVPDAETYWRWSLSHGSGRFIEGLPAGLRAEMHARLLEAVAGSFTLRRSATLWTARVS